MKFKLSDFTKGQIVSMSQEINADGTFKYTYEEIANKLGCCRQTASNVVRKYEKTKSIENFSSPGRPPKVTHWIRQYILFLVKRDPFISLVDIVTQLDFYQQVKISERTVRRVLSGFGLHSRRPSIKLLLTIRHLRARRDFCKRYKDFGEDFWERVIFSDESTFCLATLSNKFYVWRPNFHRWDPRYTKKLNYHEKRGVRVWGCLHQEGQGPLVEIQETLQSIGYIGILKRHLVPFGFSEFGKNFLFQQDNASIHTSKETNNFLNKQRFFVLDWPANSPDLNPIENLWAKISYEIKAGEPIKNLAELEEKIFQLWNEISLDYLHKIVQSMPKRISLCLQNNGYPIKY